MSFEQLVFVGFNSRVLALHRESGAIVWSWRAPKPSSGGYVTQLLDGDRLIVSVNGYIYCLDPETGQQLWFNETKGCGTGVTSIVSVRGSSGSEVALMAAAQAEAEQAARSSSTTAAPPSTPGSTFG